MKDMEAGIVALAMAICTITPTWHQQEREAIAFASRLARKHRRLRLQVQHRPELPES